MYLPYPWHFATLDMCLFHKWVPQELQLKRLYQERVNWVPAYMTKRSFWAFCPKFNSLITILDLLKLICYFKSLKSLPGVAETEVRWWLFLMQPDFPQGGNGWHWMTRRQWMTMGDNGWQWITMGEIGWQGDNETKIVWKIPSKSDPSNIWQVWWPLLLLNTKCWPFWHLRTLNHDNWNLPDNKEIILSNFLFIALSLALKCPCFCPYNFIWWMVKCCYKEARRRKIMKEDDDFL